jgi:hypothetical protein
MNRFLFLVLFIQGSTYVSTLRGIIPEQSGPNTVGTVFGNVLAPSPIFNSNNYNPIISNPITTSTSFPITPTAPTTFTDQPDVPLISSGIYNDINYS